MMSMFYEMNSLTALSLGDKFDTSKVTTMANMFKNAKTGLTIKVKDDAAKTFIQSRLTDVGITANITTA